MTNLSSIVEILAKQALGQSNSNNSATNSGLGGILGSVLGQLGGAAQNSQPTQQSGLGGVLGSVLGQLAGGANTQPQSAPRSGGSNTTKTLLVAVLPLVLAWIQKQGGIQGALDQLRGQGLSAQVDDWVSTGAGSNASVQQEQVQKIFDDQDIDAVAQQTDTPKTAVYSAISQVLPEIIDSLTPQGEQTNKQEANQDIQDVLNLVSNLFKR